MKTLEGVTCPVCSAAPGSTCDNGGVHDLPHTERVLLAELAGDDGDFPRGTVGYAIAHDVARIREIHQTFARPQQTIRTLRRGLLVIPILVDVVGPWELRPCFTHRGARRVAERQVAREAQSWLASLNHILRSAA